MTSFDETADHPWPTPLLRAVGEAWREPAGRGVAFETCRKLAEAAYLAAAGDEPDPSMTVAEMLGYLIENHGGWLCGPHDAWLEANPEP